MLQSPSLITRWFTNYVSLAERRARLLLGAFVVLAIGALVPALGLELHSDLAELLPDDHPAVRALRGIAGRQKSSTNLVLIVESPDAAANRRFAEVLRPRLERMRPAIFTEIQWRPDREIPEHAARWKWLYASRKDLENAEALLDRLIARRSSPLLVDFESGDPEAELHRLRAGIEQQLPPRPNDEHFEGEENGSHFLGVMLWRRADGLLTVGDKGTFEAVKRLVAEVGPASFHPKMKILLTGHIAKAIEEHTAVRDDLTIATAVCGSLVLLVIYLYFRRVALIAVIGAPAVLGLLLALALARGTIHHLNSNTAFLISIILGNGINSPIILLARYGEERRRGEGVTPALVTALSHTLLATGTAMSAAAIAYGSLLLTRFRGFNQFGLVGGAGMLLVWAVTFLLVPPLVLAGERWKPGLLTPRPNLFDRPFAAIARTAERHPVVLAASALVLLVGAALPLPRYLQDPLEWNFVNLGSREDLPGHHETPSQRSWRIMYKLGMGNVGAGYIARDAVLLVDRAEQAPIVAAALLDKQRASGGRRIIGEVRTLESVLPTDQPAKLELLERLRQKIDRHRSLMSDSERREVEPFRPPADLRPLTVEDLPRQVRESFTEVNGVRGRLIGIDGTDFNSWDGHDLLRFAEALQVDALGKHWVAASTSTIFAGMLETMVHDSPRVTLAALVGVVLLVFVAFGPRGAPLILASLFLGVAWLGGLLAWAKLKLNFVNFVAIPITLGIGADYAANIWARLRCEGSDTLVRVVANTGSAVALCSITTIIGYSSLLLAHNLALQSFGLLADLGEVCCLAAALFALPALVVLTRRRPPRPAASA